MTRFEISSFRRVSPNYSLRYMNIFCFKELSAPPLTLRLIFPPVKKTRNEYLSYLYPAGIAPAERNLYLNPCSVWDCKGRNFPRTPQIFFFFFSPGTNPTQKPKQTTGKKTSTNNRLLRNGTQR